MVEPSTLVEDLHSDPYPDQCPVLRDPRALYDHLSVVGKAASIDRNLTGLLREHLFLHPSRDRLDVLPADALSNPFPTQRRSSCWLGTQHRGIQSVQRQSASPIPGSLGSIVDFDRRSFCRIYDIVRAFHGNECTIHHHHRIVVYKSHILGDL